MGFEVGLDFPLFFGTQLARAKTAKLGVELAQTRMELEERRVDAELRTAENVVETAQRTYDYYQTEGLPAAQEELVLGGTARSLYHID